MIADPSRLDPTHTITLRESFSGAMRKRFGAMQRAVKELVGAEDAFGLARPDSPIVANAQYEFLTDAAKIEAFRAWLTEQIDAKVLDVDPANRKRPWLATYVERAYRQGTARVYSDVKPEAAAASLDFYAGSRAQFLTDAFNAPEAVSKLELLFTRDFELLKGVTDQMASQLNVQLADGIAHGRSPIEVARQMSNTIGTICRTRAELIARTEIIHAHAEGQLDAFDRLGIEEIGVQVEWLAAGDGKVCPRCADMHGKTFTTDEARGLIPRHPGCRCAFAPASQLAMARTLGRRRRAGQN